MSVDAKTVMNLRRETGAGMMDCKKALVETGGDLEKAKDLLRAKGMKSAEKRAGRATKEGFIATYIHHNKRLGTMVELLCETDFVARNEDFQKLAQNLAMHVAAANPYPKFLTRDEVPEEVVAREKAIFLEQVADKPEQIREKIVEGKLNSFFQERVLLEQEFTMEDGAGTIENVLKSAKSKLGENINLRRFVRFDIGEEV